MEIDDGESERQAEARGRLLIVYGNRDQSLPLPALISAYGACRARTIPALLPCCLLPVASLVLEMPRPGEDHGHVALVAGGDGLVVVF